MWNEGKGEKTHLLRERDFHPGPDHIHPLPGVAQASADPFSQQRPLPSSSEVRGPQQEFSEDDACGAAGAGAEEARPQKSAPGHTLLPAPGWEPRPHSTAATSVGPTPAVLPVAGFQASPCAARALISAAQRPERV